MNFLHERQLRRLDTHLDNRGGSTRAVEAPPRVSFEFFPPKNPQMESQLWDTVKALEPLLPQYVSVTYGAGGSTRDATFETVRRIAAKTHLRPAAHLTCVGHGRKDIAQLLERYWEAGVRHIVALRGDHPAGGGSTRATPRSWRRSTASRCCAVATRASTSGSTTTWSTARCRWGTTCSPAGRWPPSW